MRRKLKYLLTLAIALAACSRKEEPARFSAEPIPYSPQTLTKAILEGTVYPEGEEFAVSAFFNGSTPYFQDQNAAYNSSLGGRWWATSSDYFWPLEGSLTFHAFSPSDIGTISGATVSAGVSGVTASGYTIASEEQMHTSFLYSSAYVADCSIHPAAVDLTFSHALSRVVFEAKAAANYNTAGKTVTITVDKITLGSLYSKGDFAGGVWSNLTSPVTYTLADTPTELAYDGSGNARTHLMSDDVMLPQTISTLSVAVTYTVTKEEGGTSTSETATRVVPLTDVAKYEPGKKYVYTVSVDLASLYVQPSVLPWEEGTEIEFESSTSANIYPINNNWYFYDPTGVYDPEDSSIWATYVVLSHGYLDQDGNTVTTITEDIRPKYSPRLEVVTKSDGVEFELHLDNPAFKFVLFDEATGKYNHSYGQSLPIPSGMGPDVNSDGIPDGVVTYVYVVPVAAFDNDASVEEKTCILYMTTNAPGLAPEKLAINNTLPGDSIDWSEVWFRYFGPSSYTTIGRSGLEFPNGMND